MRVQNEVDRYHLLLDVIDKLGLNSKEKALVEELQETLKRHKKYIARYGTDMPEVADWKWE